ncbi:MAG: heavy metal-associated domain-containing protein [Bacteroidales bacterium]|nr:heavy metal-associated domain-containing protein [Bacteroidales bacterium]MBD5253982.1 heavy metal-associated domain-containing protein [Barnesiella sp.]
MTFLDSLLYMLNEMSPYILLGFLIAGVLHAFVSRETFARHLSGNNLPSVIKAALIGVPLPLCSCGVLPTAIAMRRNGASRAASSAFLISTPQTGVDSIAATWSLLGPAFAVLRPVTALVTAVAGGAAVGTTERGESSAETCSYAPDATDSRHSTFADKIIASLRYGFVDLVSSIGLWLTVGLIIAALITVYVPSDFFAILGNRPILSMILALLVAVPMYVCATGSIPIALSLMLKGLSPGTAFVLLMAGPAANFASFTLISREMGRRAATVYLGSIIAGAMAMGLAIDYFMPAHWFAIGQSEAMHGACHHEFNTFSTFCSAILASLLIYSLIRRFYNPQITYTDMTTEYIITGMNCPHCQNAVKKAIAAVDGVNTVEVDLQAGIATVDGRADHSAVIDAVHAAGFEAREK